MKFETTEKKVTISSIIFVLVMLAGVLMLSFSTHASLISTGNNTAIWNGNLEITFSGVANESCRNFIPAQCSLFDVGKTRYTDITGSTVDILLANDLTLLIAEPEFLNTFTITNKNNLVWSQDKATFSLFQGTAEVFNLSTGNTTGAVPGASFQTRFEVKVVPVPPALWLFGSGLIGLIGVARRKL